MPRLRILDDAPGSPLARYTLALLKHAPPDFQVSVARDDIGSEPPDLVVVSSVDKLRQTRQIIRQRGWRSKLVVSWSHGWPANTEDFFAAHRDADCVICSTEAYWRNTGRLPRTAGVHDGVDLDTFRVKVPLSSRKQRVLWAGVEDQHRTSGYARLVVPLEKMLQARGIDVELRLGPRQSSGGQREERSDMTDWYNSGTVLVCASRAEGTPSCVLEAAASGCTVVSTDVGDVRALIRDGVNGYLVERNEQAIADGVLKACQNYQQLAEQMQQDIGAWGWEAQSTKYFEVLRGLVDSSSENSELRSTPRVDLSEEVTVFVTTVGAPSFETCLEHLRMQDCSFKLEVVDHVAPVSAAAQRMLDQCCTRYFASVDEDVVLNPQAIRSLYERLSKARPEVAMVVGALFECHLERRILGVKMFRHEIVKRYPVNDVDSVDIDQNERMRADGYVNERFALKDGAQHEADGVFGLHGTHWRPQSIYEFYNTMERKSRRPSNRWFRAHKGPLLQRYVEDPSELNFFALMGFIASATTTLPSSSGSKDYRRYSTLRGLGATTELWNTLTMQSEPPGER